MINVVLIITSRIRRIVVISRTFVQQFAVTKQVLEGQTFADIVGEFQLVTLLVELLTIEAIGIGAQIIAIDILAISYHTRAWV